MWYHVNLDHSVQHVDLEELWNGAVYVIAPDAVGLDISSLLKHHVAILAVGKLCYQSTLFRLPATWDDIAPWITDNRKITLLPIELLEEQRQTHARDTGNLFYFHTEDIQSPWLPGANFAKDLLVRSIQTAFRLGFSRIYVVGRSVLNHKWEEWVKNSPMGVTLQRIDTTDDINNSLQAELVGTPIISTQELSYCMDEEKLLKKVHKVPDPLPVPQSDDLPWLQTLQKIRSQQ